MSAGLAGPGRRLALSLVLVTALGVAAGFVARGFVSPSQVAAKAAAPPSAVLTSPLELRVLNAQVVLRATVSEVSPLQVAAPSSIGQDRSVITSLAAGTGATVREGQVLASVAGRPLLVARGDIPAYRTMQLGQTGPDVAQLQKALRRMGHPPRGDQSGHYGRGTGRAVAAWYASVGFSPVGSVVPSAPMDAAEATPGPATPGEHTSDASVPLGEVTFAPALPARIISTGGRVGSVLTRDAPVLTLGSGRVDVAGLVDSRQLTALRPGQPATILSDVSGTSFAAAVTTVSRKPQSSPTGSVYAVHFRSARDLTSIVGQDVGVKVQTALGVQPTFVAPVAAVTSSADGTTSLTVREDDGSELAVAVRTGVSSDGEVAVTPLDEGALHEGDQVVLGIAGTPPS